MGAGPTKNAAEPAQKQFDMPVDLIGGIHIDGDDIGGVTFALLSHVGEYIPSVSLFDPFDGVIEPMANWNLKARVLDVFNVSLRWVIKHFLILEDMGGETIDLIAEGIVSNAVLVFALMEGIGKCLADIAEGDGIDALISFKYGFDGA